LLLSFCCCALIGVESFEARATRFQSSYLKKKIIEPYIPKMGKISYNLIKKFMFYVFCQFSSKKGN
jgi:hypothetical protein